MFQTFTLTVTGSFASLTPTSLDFGTLYRFQEMKQLVTVTNTGSAPLTHIQARIVPHVAGSREFDADVDCPFRLQAGASCEIRIQFRAVQPGTSAGTLEVTANEMAAPQELPVTATAIDPRAEFDPRPRGIRPERSPRRPPPRNVHSHGASEESGDDGAG